MPVEYWYIYKLPDVGEWLVDSIDGFTLKDYGYTTDKASALEFLNSRIEGRVYQKLYDSFFEALDKADELEAKDKKKEEAKGKPSPESTKQAHEWTDEQIESLRRKFDRAYAQAASEMRSKLDKLMADFDSANKGWLERLKAGKVTQDQYDAWLKHMSMDRSFVGGMANTLASDAADTNRLVADYINDRVPMVYAENANRAAFEVESGLGYDTHSFDLYDQSTVRRLIAEDNALVREVRPDKAKDLAWNRQKFNGAITQSILQGESIPNAAKRLRTVLGMNENAAVRAARTAMTCAENAGRTDSYKRAKRLGIELEQEWMATLDQRTRHSHRELDGQHVPVGEKFKVDGIELEYPGDPSAPGEYVWNCRCTLVAWFPDIEQEDPERWSKLPKGMTYDEWKSQKKMSKDPESKMMPWEEYANHLNEKNERVAAEMGRRQLKVVDDAGRRAISIYTGDDYWEINGDKRGGNEYWNQSTINNLDRVLGEARTDKDLVVVRGVGSASPLRELLSRSGNADAAYDPSILVGQVMWDDAYLSTSVDRFVAGGFGGGSGVLFNIHVPEGANAIYVDSISDHPGEKELLFRAHQEMVITHAEHEEDEWGDELWKIWAEIIVD